MGITLEIAAVDGETLDGLDDETGEELIASLLFAEDNPQFSAGRIWHVIHFFLTGDPRGAKGPEGFILVGGRNVGPEGAYGRARVFTPRACQAIARALISPKEFARRWREQSPHLPDDVVLGNKIRAEGPEPHPDYIEIYSDLRKFIRKAAIDGRGLLMDVI